MTNTARPSVPEPGIFRRGLAAVWAFLQAMDYTNFDYMLNRIERLEREVAQLKEEMRHGPERGAVDAHSAGAAALKE